MKISLIKRCNKSTTRVNPISYTSNQCNMCHYSYGKYTEIRKPQKWGVSKSASISLYKKNFRTLFLYKARILVSVQRKNDNWICFYLLVCRYNLFRLRISLIYIIKPWATKKTLVDLMMACSGWHICSGKLPPKRATANECLVRC